MLEQTPNNKNRVENQVPTADIFARMSSGQQEEVLNLQKAKIQQLLGRREKAIDDMQVSLAMFNPVAMFDMMDEALKGGVPGKVMGAFMAVTGPLTVAPVNAITTGIPSLYQGVATQVSLIREKLRLRTLENKFGGSK